MVVIRTIKNALALLLKGEWREFGVRARIVLGQIDLKNVTTDELGLPADRAHSYADSGGPALEKVLDAFGITAGDAVIDFGCGKGGALITLAKYPFARITGVELSDELAGIAESNLAKLHLGNVEVICCDAAVYKELDDYNYFYMFNPFPCDVILSVLDNIERSLARKARKLTVIYLNPVCHDEIVSSTRFIKIDELEHPAHTYFIYSNQA